MSENKQWLIKDSSRKVIGPYSFDAIKTLIERGLIRGDEQISLVPHGQWYEIAKEKIFYDLILDTMEGLNNSKKIDSFEIINDKTAIINRLEIEEKYKPQTPLEKKDDSIKESVASAPPVQPQNNTQITKKSFVTIPELNIKTSDGKEFKDTNVKNGSNEALEEPNSSAENNTNTLQVFNLPPERIKFFGVILVIILLLLYILYSYSDSATEGKIHLLLPSVGGEKLSIDETKSLLLKSKSLIESDNFTGWLESQNLLVKLSESDPQNIEIREMLCFVYKELWPFSFQDSEDIKTLDQMTMSVKNINPASTQSKSCQIIQAILTNKFDQALANIDGLLTESPGSALYTWLKAEILYKDKNYINAVAFASSVSSIWPQFINAFVLQGKSLEKQGMLQQALDVFNNVLKMNPNHKVAKLYAGIIEYDSYKSNDTAWTLLISAINQAEEKAPPLLESQAYRVLSEISMLKNQHSIAKEYIEKAYKQNPSDLKIKKMFSDLGGNNKIEISKSKTLELIALGDQYARTGDYFAAQAEYKTAFDLDPHYSAAAIKAAKSLWRINQSLQAIEYLKKAIKAKPSDFAAYVLLSDFYSQRYDFRAAIQILNQAQRFESNSYEIQKGLALIELRKNNYIAASALAEKSLKIYNSDVETYVILAQSYLGQKKISEAFHAIAKAVEIDPSHIEAQVTYGNVLHNYQGFESARTYLDNLSNQSKFILDYKIAIAEMLKKEEKFDQALELYQKVLLVDSKFKKASISSGECLQSMGQVDKALSAFLNAATLDPTDPEALFKAGLLYLETGRFGPAIQQFERVLLVNKNYPRTNYFIGKAAYLQGDMQKAIDFATIEKKQNPRLAEPYILSAEVYSAARKYQLCTTEYQMALKLQNLGADVYVKLARCFRLTGTMDVAQSMLDIAAEKESGYPDIYKERGALYQAQGEIAAALKAYDKYLSLSPSAPDRAEVELLMNSMLGSKRN